MISAPVVITGRSSRRYTTSVVRVEACPARRAISSMLTPRWLIKLTKEVRSSRGVQQSPVPGLGADPLEHLPDVSWVQGGAAAGGEDQPGVLPAVPGREPLGGLAVRPGARPELPLREGRGCG